MKTLKPLWLFALALFAPDCGAQSVKDLAAMSLEELGNIEITTFRNKAQKLSSVAAPVYVITSEQIARSGLSSVPELLRLAPGLQVAHVNGSQWSVSARGNVGVYSPRLLVLIDGRSIYTPIFSGVYWDLGMPLLEDIDRIEVIRGPGATIWGANAVLGVINIVTRHTQDTQGTLLVAGGGVRERAFGAVRVGSQSGEVSWRAWVRAEDHAPNVAAGGGVANDGWNTEQVGFRMDGESLGGAWMLQGSASASPGRLPGVEYSLATQKLEQTPFDMFSAAGNLTGEYRRPVKSNGELRFNFYFDQLVKQHTPDRISHSSTWDGTLRYDFSLANRHAISVGGGVRAIRESVPGTGESYFTPSLMKYANYNLFIQDEAQLIKDRLVLTYGTKIEHNHFTGWGLEPSASLLYQPAKHHSLWVSTARSHRTPSFLEQAVRSTVALLPASPLTGGLPAAVVLMGNPNVANESVTDVQAGYRGELGRRLSVSISLYRDLYHHLRSFADGSPSFQARPVPSLVIPTLLSNYIEGIGKGVESTLSWKPARWWKVDLVHTFARTSLWPMASAPAGTSQIDTFEPPRHRGSVQSGWNLGRRWEVDFSAFWRGNIVNKSYVGLLKLDAQARADARIGFKLTDDATLSVAAQNLFSARTIEGIPETLATYTQIRRSAYVKCVWRF